MGRFLLGSHHQGSNIARSAGLQCQAQDRFTEAAAVREGIRHSRPISAPCLIGQFLRVRKRCVEFLNIGCIDQQTIAARASRAGQTPQPFFVGMQAAVAIKIVELGALARGVCAARALKTVEREWLARERSSRGKVVMHTRRHSAA